LISSLNPEVTNSKSPSVVTIRLNSGTRWLLLLPALLAILGAWFVVRWYIGNTVAEYAPDVAEGGIDLARMAVRWAPGDPLTHWRLGSLEEKVFSAENMADAVREYQLAVTLSPNDYRYWMELGRALEASGDRESGEKALRRAVELAPAYSHPRWHLGNLLLREGKLGEAFEQLGHAAEADNLMRPQVFDLAMNVFNGDVNEIAKVACVSPAARMQLAIYLVAMKRFDDGMRLWSSTNPADRSQQIELAKEMRRSLIEAKQFHYALALIREMEPDANLPQPEQFWNGGFESDLKLANASTFDWVIDSRASAQVAIDSHPHSGQRSLRIVLRAPRTLDNIHVSQTVTVEPGVRYRFECYVRTEDLISASTPILAVFDAVDHATLVASNPLPTGTNDWQKISLEFTANPKHDGITVGFYRVPCPGEGQICPIFGTVWYDDFNLQRIGGLDRKDAGSSKR
jgi:tetratricopeptide (TPR) repeat protein